MNMKDLKTSPVELSSEELQELIEQVRIRRLARPTKTGQKTLEVDLSGSATPKKKKTSGAKAPGQKQNKADAILSMLSTMSPEQKAAFVKQFLSK